MKIELGVSLGKEPPETSVIKKPNWSKVSVNDILDYSYNNIDWYPTSRSYPYVLKKSGISFMIIYVNSMK